MIGDYLYQQTAKDRAGLGIDLVRKKDTVVEAAAITAKVYFVVPNDRVWILQSIVAVATPGAAQAVQAIEIAEGINNGGVIAEPIHYLYGSRQAHIDSIAGFPAATEYQQTVEFDNLMVPANKVIRVRARFDAFANANTLTAFLAGYSIPRGSIAF